MEAVSSNELVVLHTGTGEPLKGSRPTAGRLRADVTTFLSPKGKSEALSASLANQINSEAAKDLPQLTGRENDLNL